MIEKVCEQAREAQPRLNGAARCVMKSWLKNSSYDHSKAFRKQAAHFKTACWIADQSNMNNLEIIMNRYRLIIRNNDRLLGHFESAVPGAQAMSSTLEIIHKYHIISAQISAWEKPF
ncbi:hypothetical protein QVM55_29515, partial [Pseudomonas monteilii]|uniref:hypothetical protein n=1 Tax=Pseudomonas monteilii TaxID=76759 RepID=UPI003524BE09